MATKANRSIKVSQATIDKIKKQGMTASLKSASGNNSPEYREALRRMYGDARLAKATASTKASSTKASSSGRYVGSMFVPDKKPAAKPSGGGKYVGSMFVADKAPAKRASTSYSPTPMKSPVKPKSKPKANGSQRLAQPLYDALGRAYAKTPKAKRDAAYAKGPAAYKKYLAEKNK